jgi:gamma-glutamyltranspeptidase/glutathione hydrolase
VDATATSVGLAVLRSGGNAVDAAVAAAATLGVTEPFSSGIGGGGFLVFYNARTGKVSTIDGREAAPTSMGETAFVNPDTGLPYAFQEARVSGLSVGVPGTVATWDRALRQWGTRSLLASLLPAAIVARRGFTVDQTFRTQIADNAAAFAQFSSTSALYLPGGAPPAVGSTFRNPDLARTYERIALGGVNAFYRGPIARDIVTTVEHPPVVAAPPVAWPFPIRPGDMSTADLAGVLGANPAAHPRDLPGPGRLRHGDALQRRLDRRRGAQHHRERAPHRPYGDPAHLSRGERARLRRPQPLRRRQHAAGAARRTAQRRLRRRAGL